MTQISSTWENVHAAARVRMCGFDDLPQALRQFLHEYGHLPPDQLNVMAAALRGGLRVEVWTPDGKRFVLSPDS